MSASILLATLNGAAREKFAEAEKVRVKVENGVTFFRPTLRVSGVNLPKGERLRPLDRKGNALAFTLQDEGFQAGTSMFLQEDKYGWFAAVELTDEVKRNDPQLKFTKASAAAEAAAVADYAPKRRGRRPGSKNSRPSVRSRKASHGAAAEAVAA